MSAGTLATVVPSIRASACCRLRGCTAPRSQLQPSQYGAIRWTRGELVELCHLINDLRAATPTKGTSNDATGFWSTVWPMFVSGALVALVVALLGLAVTYLVTNRWEHQRDERDRRLQQDQASRDQALQDWRASLEQDNTNRLESFRRMRAVHVAVAYAQGLIVADNSGQTYLEQLRKFMILTYELEDIAEDVKVARKRKLFEPFDDMIIKGIEGIIKFLKQLTEEYIQCRSDVEADAGLNKGFATTIEERRMSYVNEFIEAYPEFPTLYKASVDMSKGKMREKIYGLRE